MSSGLSQLREYDPFHDLPENPVVLLYGVRGSGKTVLMHHMLFSIQRRLQTHSVYLFSPTAGFKPEMYYMWPPSAIFTDMSRLNDELGDIIDKQVKILEDGWQDIARQHERSGQPESADKDGANGRSGAADGWKAQMNLAQEEKEGGTVSSSDEELDRGAHGRAYTEKQYGTSKGGEGGGSRGRYDWMRNRKNTHDTTQESEHVGEALNTAEHLERSDERFQRLMAKLGSDPDKAQKLRQDLPHVLIALDDVVNEQTVRTSPRLGQLAIAGRHLNCFLIILSQGISGSQSVPPIVRSQVDFIVLLAQPKSVSENKVLGENYLCLQGNKKNCEKGHALIGQICAMEHRATVVHVSHVHARAFSEFVHTYGPCPMPPCPESFRLGQREQWKEVALADRKYRDKAFKEEMIPKKKKRKKEPDGVEPMGRLKKTAFMPKKQAQPDLRFIPPFWQTFDQ